MKERCVKERGGSGGDGTAVRGEGEWWLAGMPRLMCVLVNGLSLVFGQSQVAFNLLVNLALFGQLQVAVSVEGPRSWLTVNNSGQKNIPTPNLVNAGTKKCPRNYEKRVLRYPKEGEVKKLRSVKKPVFSE